MSKRFSKLGFRGTVEKASAEFTNQRRKEDRVTVSTQRDTRSHEKELQNSLWWASSAFGPKMVLLCGLGPETGVLLDATSQMGIATRKVTIDTGRLHPESLALMDRYRARYGVTIEVFSPHEEDLAHLAVPSLELFRKSDEARKQCCEARKNIPLARALAGCPAWMSGLRSDSGIGDRVELPLIQTDEVHGGIIKMNPLARWAEDAVWAYILEHDVPYHALYQKGYGSIGCIEPCTVPGSGRTGRWGWLRERTEAHCSLNQIKTKKED